MTAPGDAPLAVLVGPPGAGKSTIGRRLSRALGVPLTDSDELIEQREGRSCGDVFADLGEPRFRELEEEMVAEALTRPGIVSLGGGAVLSPATRSLLARHVVVYLEIDAEEGVRRTAGEATRPVLAADDPAAHYRALLDRRRPLYEEVATFRARSGGRTPQQVVAEILGFLESDEDEAAIDSERNPS